MSVDKKRVKGKDNNSFSSQMKKQRARTVQQTLPFLCMYQNGMIKNEEKVYSNTYRFEDINYAVETEEGQEHRLSKFCKVLNKFGPDVTVQYNLINSRVSEETIAADFYIQGKRDDEIRATDSEREIKVKEVKQVLREEYNARIITDKIKEGRNDIRKNRYITLALRAENPYEANKKFNTLETELQTAFKEVNKTGVKRLNAEERLALFKALLWSGKDKDFSKQLNKYRNEAGELSLELLSKKGVTVKDLIAPSYIANGKKEIVLGGGETPLCVGSFLVTDLPTALETSFLTKITDIPCAMSASIIHATKPKKKALREVKIHANSIKADVVKANKGALKSGYDPTLISENLQDAREESSLLIKDMTINSQKLFYSTVTVTIFADSQDELTEFSTQLAMKVSDFDCSLMELYCQQILGLKNCLPLASNHLAHNRLLTTESASAFFPFYMQELMDPKGHFYGINAISKNMIMINRKDLALPNGLILGKAGSGKSFIAKGEIIPIILDYDDDVIIVDPDAEYVEIAKALGGTVVDVQTNAKVRINPLDLNMDYLNTDSDKPDPVAEKCDYVIGLVESCLGKYEVLTPYDENVIIRCTTKIYKEYVKYMDEQRDQAIREGKPIISYDPEACPTLVNLYEALNEDGSQEGHHLAMALENYCVGTNDIFAHKTNISGTPRFLVYNIKSMPEKMRELTMKVCTSDVWNRVKINKQRKKATWVYIDEFYLLMQTPGAARTIQQFYKRIRKYYGVMTGITQDIEDLLVTQEGRGMLNNTGFTIMMKQSQIGRAELAEQYNISPSLLDYVREDNEPGVGLIHNGNIVIPFNYVLPTDTKLYKLMSTKPSEG